MRQTRAEAEAALAALRLILAELGLELKDAKTRIVHLTVGGEGVDFLGFHHRGPARAAQPRRLSPTLQKVRGAGPRRKSGPGPTQRRPW